MKYPMVFRSRAHLNWMAAYAPGSYDTYPTWREAWEHLVLVVGMRMVAAEVMADEIAKEGESDGCEVAG